MTFDLAKLFLTIAGSLFLGSFALLAARGTAQRLMLFGFLSGLAWYSSIGAAVPEVPYSFIGYYFMFFAAVIIGFHFALPLFLSFGLSLGRHMPQTLGSMDRGKGWIWLIAIYVLLSAFPLIWPEFRLLNLLAPPSPDLKTIFYKRFIEEPDVILKLVGYAHLLLTPFFYLALYRLRHSLRWIVAVFALLLYMKYVDQAYIGRGDVMMHIGLLVLAVWFLRPAYRRKIIAIVVALSPVFLYACFWYGRIRIGGAVGDVGFGEAMLSILAGELGFPKNVGVPILEAGARVDISAYFTWIATLPIPIGLTGAIEGARVNYEISEVVLGLPTGSPGWYVVLPGLVAESVYIYGSYFFWLHGIFLGIMAAFFARIAERIPQFLFLYLYLVLMFAYVLNRAGIAALLPPVINKFLFFYLFLFFVIFRTRHRTHAAPRPIQSRESI